MSVKRFCAPIVFKDAGEGEEQGHIEAVISTFGILDADREIVMASAFTDGQEIPLIWGHDWASLPIGKGTMSVQPDRAVFSGRLFMDTTHGMDAFRTMRNMGALQQFSWGFTPTKTDVVEIDGEQVRRILESRAHEVSAVLVGSNPQTGILAIKGHGLSFEDHSERVQVAVSELIERAKSGADLRIKEGRPMTEARRRFVAEVRDGLRGHADGLDALLVETEPKPKAPPEKAAEDTGAQAQRVAVLRLRSEFDQGRLRRARTLGVSA